MIFPVFFFVCWVYILPVVSLFRRFGPVVAAVVPTVTIWFVALFIFHEPLLDPLWASVAATGVVIGLPVFAAALLADIIMWPNSAFQGTLRDKAAQHP